jgi:nitrite reductase/ring-hydroxylating ferredoxin subunit
VIDLCALADVPDGGALLVPGAEGGAGTEHGVVIVRDGDAVFAYENRCPHFGIRLEVGRGIKTFRKHVLCVNHYAAFRFADGYCVEGPCLGASLYPIALTVAAGRIARDDIETSDAS